MGAIRLLKDDREVWNDDIRDDLFWLAVKAKCQDEIWWPHQECKDLIAPLKAAQKALLEDRDAYKAMETRPYAIVELLEFLRDYIEALEENPGAVRG